MKKGFTLIELLVVISIIAMLSSVILASLSTAEGKGKLAKTEEDAHSIETQIEMARLNAGEVTGDITDDWCTACSFGYPSMTVPENSQPTALARNNESWKDLGFSAAPIDAWGNPYSLDENENENGSSDCGYDWVFAPGPSGIIAGECDDTNSYPVDTVEPLGDGYCFDVSHFICNP